MTDAMRDGLFTTAVTCAPLAPFPLNIVVGTAEAWPSLAAGEGFGAYQTMALHKNQIGQWCTMYCTTGPKRHLQSTIKVVSPSTISTFANGCCLLPIPHLQPL